MKFLSLLFLIIGISANCFSQSKLLKFNDDSQLSLSKNVEPQKDFTDTGRIVRKEVTAVYTGLGRSSPSYTFGQFSENSDAVRAAKLTRKQRNLLFGKIDRINTAYSFKQGENEFYIDGFNSVDSRQFDGCQKCEIKMRLILLELKANGVIYYSPIIESIEKVKNIESK